jgi:hypothetical protein
MSKAISAIISANAEFTHLSGSFGPHIDNGQPGYPADHDNVFRNHDSAPTIRI